ncbi:hypothetical protein CHLNCDRAFT_144372 [Chlorella variabilis]|uniref:MATH domain-containing protein n=1 Tax=Chlorella variabilis TaxID=554065 RepID=E1ZBA6_CHLVA|nr:hypothetical protein CHLNCDRAFT_144372 [Chlorella variabilis]EFN56822.1 hypothetical protein CHLNCDRAFT_144372 [Chlorella variabilis]|eukprot:XP_005848924.1 hypothetical protein CHLNCDRAFT_144372 [Chlorella variabilis]
MPPSTKGRQRPAPSTASPTSPWLGPLDRAELEACLQADDTARRPRLLKRCTFELGAQPHPPREKLPASWARNCRGPNSQHALLATAGLSRQEATGCMASRRRTSRGSSTAQGMTAAAPSPRAGTADTVQRAQSAPPASGPPESVDEVPPGKLGGKAAVALLKRSPSALPAWLDDPLPTLSLPLPGGAVRPPKAPIAPPPERRQVQRQELPHAPVSTAGAQQEQQAPAAGGVELDWLLPDVAHASGALQSPSIKLGEQEWRLVAYPQGLNGRGRSLSVYLSAVGGHAFTPFSSWRQRLMFVLTVVSARGGMSLSRLEEHTFDPLEPQYGFTTLISRSELLDPAAGFLRDDGGVLLRASLVPMPC